MTALTLYIHKEHKLISGLGNTNVYRSVLCNNVTINRSGRNVKCCKRKENDLILHICTLSAGQMTEETGNKSRM